MILGFFCAECDRTVHGRSDDCGHLSEVISERKEIASQKIAAARKMVRDAVPSWHRPVLYRALNLAEKRLVTAAYEAAHEAALGEVGKLIRHYWHHPGSGLHAIIVFAANASDVYGIVD